MNKIDYPLYEFPECNSIVVSGDIHGDFNVLVNKMCVQYGMRDTLLIVAGDCGFGFQKKGYYEDLIKRNSKRMNDANNWILFVRGNHDNPAYFDGIVFHHSRFMAIPDYSIVKAKGHVILCVGGAISLDRQQRLKEWDLQLRKESKYSRISSECDNLDRNYYWTNEYPVYNEEILAKIISEEKIDCVVTHTAPSFCELQNKNGLNAWAEMDESLIDDVKNERETMDCIYRKLKSSSQPLSHWFYGHFHQSWHSSIEGVLFKMLDVMEFTEII